MTTAATSRGTTRYFIGLVESVFSASICSVTRMVPISAAMAAAMRPATIRPAITGPSSRVMPSTTMLERSTSAPKRLPPMIDLQRQRPPVKNAVRPDDRQGKITDPHHLLTDEIPVDRRAHAIDEGGERENHQPPGLCEKRDEGASDTGKNVHGALT